MIPSLLEHRFLASSFHLAACDFLFQPVYQKMYGKNLALQNSLYAKVMSVMYGMVCISFAFMADRLGGVLQASLTILGVVGGPTLGLFSLGMFVPLANEMVHIASSIF